MSDEGVPHDGPGSAAGAGADPFVSGVGSINDASQAASAPVTSSVTGRTRDGDGGDEPEDDRPLLSDDSGGTDDPEDRARYARATAALAGSTAPGEQRLSSLQFMALSSYWFGWSFLWLPLLIVIIPYQINVHAVREGLNKGSSLGTTLLLGSFVSLFCAPVFGSMSDSCRNRYGRRRPFMITGTVIATLSLFVLAIAPTLGWFSFGFLALSVANNMILSPYSALVPDVVPADQRGLASGWLGLMSILGYLAGGVVSYYMNTTGVFLSYFALAVVHALSMVVTVYYVHETPLLVVQSPSGMTDRLASVIKPLRSHDFRVVFFTRFLMQMGILTVQEYLQYYLQDAIAKSGFLLGGVKVADNAQQAVSILFLPVLVGALLSSIVSGWVSDRVTRSYAFDMFLGLMFGIGFGAFSTMDWAMATDVLPHINEFAKDMGVWSLALILPQVIAAPIAGVALDYFQNLHIGVDNFGYSVVFLLAVVYFALGTYFVKELEGVA